MDSVQSWDRGVSLRLWDGMGWDERETYPVLEIWIRIGAGFADLVPVGGEGFVSRVVPVVKDLVDDFGDVLMSGLVVVVLVEVGGFALGYGDAGVLEEDFLEGEDSADRVP